MTTNTNDLTNTLTLLYNLDDSLMIALEAFVRKTFLDGDAISCKLNIERFIINPATLFKLLEDVIYDDLGGFSYAQDWEIDYGIGVYKHKHDQGRDSLDLFWLVNGQQVPVSFFEDIEDEENYGTEYDAQDDYFTEIFLRDYTEDE